MATATLPDGTKIELPTVHVAVGGPPGSGKTEFFSTFPKPMLVCASDPMGKMLPYFQKGKIDPEIYKGAQGQVVRLVKSKKSDAPIIQIEGFYDTNPKAPGAMQTFLTRMEYIQQEVANGMWSTVIFDSWSGFEDIAVQRRQTGQYATNNRDSRAHYADAKDDIKQILINRIIHLNCYVGIVLHLSEKTSDDGSLIKYDFKTIGDLATTIGRNIPERYRAEAQADGITRKLYTRPDGRYNLTTMLGAPSPCENSFGAIFTNWVAQQVAMGAADAKPTNSVTEVTPIKE